MRRGNDDVRLVTYLRPFPLTKEALNIECLRPSLRARLSHKLRPSGITLKFGHHVTKEEEANSVSRWIARHVE